MYFFHLDKNIILIYRSTQFLNIFLITNNKWRYYVKFLLAVVLDIFLIITKFFVELFIKKISDYKYVFLFFTMYSENFQLFLILKENIGSLPIQENC